MLYIIKINFEYNLKLYLKYLNKESHNWGLGIGDWGLGIGDWAQSPIPNPQPPIPNPHVILYSNISNIILNYIQN
jgi:hypothetical protein